MTPRFATAASATLVCLVVGMALVSFITQGHRYLPFDGSPLGRVLRLDRGAAGIPWLSVDAEQSIPAWFSSSALLLSAVLLHAVSWRCPPRTTPRQWNILAVIFVFLSLDEAVALHEKTILPLRSAWGTSGLLHYAWVIPAGIAVAVLAIVYARFLVSLPPRTRMFVIVGALLYVGGALGVEALGGQQAEAHGQSNLAYVTLSTVEELMEMLGVVALLHALMLLLVRDKGAAARAPGSTGRSGESLRREP